MACGCGSSSVTNNPVLKEMVCVTNIGTALKWSLGFVISGITMSVTYLADGLEYVKAFWNSAEPSYVPFSLSSDILGYEMNCIEPAAKMEGTAENDLMIAHPDGSKIFAKGGLNYMKAGPGPDEFYFSLCSTDIIDNKVSVIEGFSPKNSPFPDKVSIFCSNRTISFEDVDIFPGNIGDIDVTYVEVAGANKTSAIAFVGGCPTIDDITLNLKWADA